MDFDHFLTTSPVGKRVALTFSGEEGVILNSAGDSGVALLYRVRLDNGREVVVADTNFRLI